MRVRILDALNRHSGRNPDIKVWGSQKVRRARNVLDFLCHSVQGALLVRQVARVCTRIGR